MSRTLVVRRFLGLLWVLGAGLPAVGPIVAAEPLQRFDGLERLYFERLEDPATAGGGVIAYLVEPLRQLLPGTLGDGEGARSEPLVVTDLDGPIHSGLRLQDFPLPGASSGSGSFLRQVINGTHPRLHSQYWAVYAGGVRTDLWFFTPYDPERITDSEGVTKVLAPHRLEEILSRPDGTLVLRVSGSVFRPLGAGWLYGTDLVFDPLGVEMRYRYAVRRYNFDFPYDEGGEERHAYVGFEEEREVDGEKTLIRRVYDGVLAPARCARCGFEVTETGFPRGGTFAALAEIASCITAWPEATTERRRPETPSYLERGWQRPEAAEPGARKVKITAVVVRLERQAHQEWLEDGSVILSDVVTLSPVEGGEGEGEIAVLSEGHPHLEGRPLQPGDRLTFVLPPDWRSYDLWFHRLQDLSFAEGIDPKEEG